MKTAVQPSTLAVKTKQPGVANMERRATQNGRSVAANETTTVTGKRLKYSIDEILGMGDSVVTERGEKQQRRKVKRDSALAGKKLCTIACNSSIKN